MPSPLRMTVLAVLAGLLGCATAPKARPTPAPERVPVLWVHGIDDHPGSFAPLKQRLRDEGWPEERLAAARLAPNNGQIPIEAMALQVARAAERLRRRTGAERIDVVAFSMGSLVTRYWLQELEGHRHVRRYVSLSGPHHGTYLAYLRRGAGIVQMRPGSTLLRALESRPNPFGDTEVFSFWTPFDTTIYPASSSHLPGATERTFPVLMHPMMMGDPGVLSAVVEALSKPAHP